MVTDYAQIQKWWEIVMSAYLMVSLHTSAFNPSQASQGNNRASSVTAKFSYHRGWNEQMGWKHLLNNLRLVIQPWVLFNLLQPWLKVFPIPQFSMGFARLIALMNHFQGALPVPNAYQYLLFSSA